MQKPRLRCGSSSLPALSVRAIMPLAVGEFVGKQTFPLLDFDVSGGVRP